MTVASHEYWLALEQLARTTQAAPFTNVDQMTDRIKAITYALLDQVGKAERVSLYEERAALQKALIHNARSCVTCFRGEYKGHVVRYRYNAAGGEWQVIKKRMIVQRCEFDHHAKDWIDRISP